jgi:hypothetical protein
MTLPLKGEMVRVRGLCGHVFIAPCTEKNWTEGLKGKKLLKQLVGEEIHVHYERVRMK